jgi:hypothetical protein
MRSLFHVLGLAFGECSYEVREPVCRCSAAGLAAPPRGAHSANSLVFQCVSVHGKASAQQALRRRMLAMVQLTYQHKADLLERTTGTKL